eukprot:Hpha_TRINITY_DN36050_c0_g1::TRINITY_DN36050_c0_g1_i1::g.170864::m.170864
MRQVKCGVLAVLAAASITLCLGLAYATHSGYVGSGGAGRGGEAKGTAVPGRGDANPPFTEVPPDQQQALRQLSQSLGSPAVLEAVRSAAPSTPTPSHREVTHQGASAGDLAGGALTFSGSRPAWMLPDAAAAEAHAVRRWSESEQQTWYEGVADQPLKGLDRSTGGAIGVLYSRKDPLVWRLLNSLCNNVKGRHPLLLFWTEHPGPPPELRRAIAGSTSGGYGCVDRQVWFVEIPAPFWRIAGEGNLTEEGDVSAQGGYRRMCWFWHKTVFTLPCLEGVELLMRLDTDSDIATPPLEDPISAVAERNASYGYVSFCFDNAAFTRGLWQHVADWLGDREPRWKGFSLPSRVG